MSLVKVILAITFTFQLTAVFAQSPSYNCKDYRDWPVLQIPAGIPDAAMARTLITGQSVIYYNPLITSKFTPLFKDFLFAHECGHHVLGHGSIAPVNEQDADCWAIRTLVNKFGLPRDRIPEIQTQIAAFGVGDWTHLPGPLRAAHLPLCLT